MKKPSSYAEAKRILKKVTRNHAFWLCTNEDLRSLQEISDALKNAEDEVYRYHVNRDKNDFEGWIRDVKGDRELAREITRIKTKDTLIRKIDDRINGLK